MFGRFSVTSALAVHGRQVMYVPSKHVNFYLFAPHSRVLHPIHVAESVVSFCHLLGRSIDLR